MTPIEFEYEIKGQTLRVIARCKGITDAEEIQGLSLTFMDKYDNRIKISYDKELFEELEQIAVDLLAEEYYNPSINFNS